ncbi:putative nicotinamide N-methyltransferase [Pseudohyphozyma bogoriensis]|nr:putative nicotinamide N-methyltransferase [Pseudohyphozyma bogoriensis]
MVGPAEVQVGLVSGHPLWGHILYPAAIAMSRFLELHSSALLRGDRQAESKGKSRAKNVLELGAGGGLPGLVAALEGAANVVISDFPDPSLVNNLAKNVKVNVTSAGSPSVANTVAEGYTWGSSPSTLLSHLPTGEAFDLILLSDLVFNHSQHSALLDSCLACLSPLPTPTDTTKTPYSPMQPDIDLSTPETLATPALLCFYSHHRPTEELIAADLGFLTTAKAKGWKVERVWKDTGAGPAFPEDAGDLCIRGTVHGWLLTR